jgi:transposase-like protein
VYNQGGCTLQKKYIVRLSEEERAKLCQIARKFNGSSQRIRRAQILLQADVNGPGWTDAKIAEAYSCRTKTVENVRERLVTEGFEVTLNGKSRATPPRRKVLDGAQEAQVIALRLGSPPEGFAHWTLRLLAERIVVLEIAETISYETVRRTLKKTA